MSEERERVWLYDTYWGQGCVLAPDAESARREAVLDAGRAGGVSDVHEATPDELAFRRAMGGYVPGGDVGA